MARWERKGLTLALALAVMTAGVTGCSDDEGNGDIDTGAAGNINVVGSPINFREVPLNGEALESILIRNDGTGTLRIKKISIDENNSSDGDQYDGEREFWRGDTGWDNESFEIAPGDSHSLNLKYAPENQITDSGDLVIESNDPDAPEFRVPITTSGLAPEIATERTVNFERVPPNTDDPNWEGAWKRTTVQNLGAAPLKIDDIYVNGSNNFRVTFPAPDAEVGDTGSDTDQWPQTLAPDDTFDVRVWFKPDDNLPETGELVFESNDPDNEQHIVTLNGNSGAACIQVSPGDEVNFGQASLGQTSQKTVTIENCSRSSQLEISSIDITDDGGGAYAIQDGSLPGNLPGDIATIEPQERANFVVTFEPATETNYNGEITINSNDPATGILKLPIVGEGSDNACPTAKARAWIQGTNRQQTTIETIPLNTIQFDGSQSTDQNGTVERYEWTILSRPQGSTQRLLPANNIEQPRLFLDLAGEYEIELKVYDDQGAASCGDPAIITIIAVPEDDVHVQLVWDTPSDPDQTDTFGTDLDLHYLHPNGRWDDPPWDIFWRNPQADWGTQGSGADDPSLDIDDTDGAGPENINHSGLENLTYKTGVYYYSDNTLGASYATLRVYVRGQLELEIENKYMPRTGSFWDAAIITWPSANVTNISRMYQGFPGSP
ncbi:choice-of-anchor D domain-containing protein [Persicimonas caeni]|nr:choice-of-anchor D domain-containing protein [Persicimonas caeni]